MITINGQLFSRKSPYLGDCDCHCDVELASEVFGLIEQLACLLSVSRIRENIFCGTFACF